MLCSYDTCSVALPLAFCCLLPCNDCAYVKRATALYHSQPMCSKAPFSPCFAAQTPERDSFVHSPECFIIVRELQTLECRHANFKHS